MFRGCGEMTNFKVRVFVKFLELTLTLTYTITSSDEHGA